MKATDPPVVVEHRFDVSPDKIWTAITDPEQMRLWYFEDMTSFEAVVGFKTEFDVDSGTQVFPHHWEVTEVVLGQRIRYEWHYKGFQGKASVEFEIDSVDQQSRLRVTATAIEDFQDDIPEFTRESCEDGWNYLIQQSLLWYLEEPE